MNKRVFGLVRTGYADGIHDDDGGRVWTAERESTVIQSPSGTLLGALNPCAFGIDTTKDTSAQIANIRAGEGQAFRCDV